MGESRPGQGTSPTALRLVRMALLGGVVIFGAVVAFLVQSQPPRAPELARPLQYVNIAYLLGAAAVIILIQRRHERERDPARRGTLNVVAWAVGESVALFGGVHYLLAGSPIPYLVGLGMLLASFALVPVRE